MAIVSILSIPLAGLGVAIWALVWWEYQAFKVEIVERTEQNVTSPNRLYIYSGMITQRRTTIMVDRITRTEVSTTIFSRIFGYGTVTIVMVSGERIVLRGLVKPKQLSFLLGG